MLQVWWELPGDSVTREVWRASAPHPRMYGTTRLELAFQGTIGVGARGSATYEVWRADYGREQYADALNALVATNMAWLGRHRKAPGLYESGVRYARECCGEVWRTTPLLYLRGVGDCEDLAASRVAELRLRGVDANILLSEEASLGAGSSLYHVRVSTPGGVEDPSAILGDNGAAPCDPLGPLGRPCGRMQQ